MERAHQAAVKDALAFLERHALFSREGADGVRQVETRGLIATAFTHRDSRAGDPDLHTHVAVANKVQTRADGRWLAIDGRVLFAATVAASETYNTALEHHLTDSLGVRFEARPASDPRKRPVREIVGIDPALAARWSSRRASIEVRRAELTRSFQATHRRPPSPVESLQLAQQATLETRDAKHEPRSLAEQRATWAEQAREVLGGERQVRAMVHQVLHPVTRDGHRVDAAWVYRTGAGIQQTLQERRSTWRRWHVEAEALRRVRGAAVSTHDVNRVVSLLVDEVLTRHSVRLAPVGDSVSTPAVLQRSDGASVYTVAGSDLYTSPELLGAEARIVTHAGRFDGTRTSGRSVEQALVGSAAAGLPLNAGQAELVRQMATSGARVQLAIAPAGSGKTTAMRALTAAWTGDGGEVVGLAPSAAAAAVLGESIGASTDTMAKLLWHLEHDPTHLPEWADRIGPKTLVVVDEAGMADTLSLDRLIAFAVDRGANVRLVGDDQQLSAVGAGGVLRDVRATHGALHLTELMRFTDPAEGAASLALRDGLPESLGFYLDRGRVHVGDLSTSTDTVFDAWCADRAQGRDAVMLAPTRELVAELNERARAHRLDRQEPDVVARLADGSHASVDDVVITRSNNRNLRLSSTDWVKNGDRWHVTEVNEDGSLTARHTSNGLTVQLPAEYVRANVELGYASTIHTAQGVTADAGHTLLTGQESRQLTYTAITRGRTANHLYLEVVDDGDPHNVIRPEHVHPLTATDLLERILARDEAAQSAHTTRRLAEAPNTMLGQAVARYVDSLYVGAEQAVGRTGVEQLDATADDVVPGVTQAPAWPTLRAHLLLLSAQDGDPLTHLRAAAGLRELGSAVDTAAVLDWRLDDTGLRNVGPGPLPWLPGIPASLGQDPQWGPYLAARAAQVRDLTGQVAAGARSDQSTPVWARNGQQRPEVDLLVDVAIWRAASQVTPEDRRPTGSPQLGKAAAQHQASLDALLARQHAPAAGEWLPPLEAASPDITRDAFAPVLAERLAALSRAGLDAPTLIRDALSRGSLPDDHAAAALWWRLSAHLSPAVAVQAETDTALQSSWTPRLGDLVGAQAAEELRTSPWWPALVTAVNRALARGSNLETLLAGPLPTDDVDPCQALVWRISVLNDTAPAEHPEDDHPGLPAGESDPFAAEVAAHLTFAPSDDEWAGLVPLDDVEPRSYDDATATETVIEPLDDPAFVEAILSLATAARTGPAPLPPTDRMVDAQSEREFNAVTAPVTPARIAQLNQLAAEFYAAKLPGSWAQVHLRQRLGTDLSEEGALQAGYAPAGWTHLVDHLRRHGASDLELTEAGLATVARTGRLIDRFRDRLVLPITRQAPTGTQTLGFVGRRNPDAPEQTAGPKYLNTPDTALFHKGAQLFTVGADLLAAGATPVLVEGPMDALAVTLAGRGAYAGVAPLGTSLTEEQASELAHLGARTGTSPVVATDADIAGQVAAQRDYWLLAQHALTPTTATLRPGSDPSSVLESEGSQVLHSALRDAEPLAKALIRERLDNLSGVAAAREAARVLAAGDVASWDRTAAEIARETRLPEVAVRRELARAIQQWDHDPRATVAESLGDLKTIRDRTVTSAEKDALGAPTKVPDQLPVPPPHARPTAPLR